MLMGRKVLYIRAFRPINIVVPRDMSERRAVRDGTPSVSGVLL